MRRSLLPLALLVTSNVQADMPPMFAGAQLGYQFLNIDTVDTRPAMQQQSFDPELAVGNNDSDYGFVFSLGKRYEHYRLYGSFSYADFDQNDLFALLGSADYIYDINHQISLFAGVSAGVSFIDVDSSRDVINLDNDVESYAIGGQLGLLYRLDETYELEVGYRALVTDLEFNARFPDVVDGNSIRRDTITSTTDFIHQIYIGFNGYF